MESLGVLLSFTIALASGFALAAFLRRRPVFAMDVPSRIQAVHAVPTPRIGGLAIYAALAACAPFLTDPGAAAIVSTLVWASLPALVAGLTEDLTGAASIKVRLLATFASAALAYLSTGVLVERLGIPVIDAWMTQPWVRAAFTIAAVAGVANAFNIIDGFNGLAAGTCLVLLAAIAAIAARHGDVALVVAACALAASVFGFALVNFPFGKLFLGDCGAYFIGFCVGWLAVLLPARHPDVSPWASLLICAYPVTEVLYSVCRRWHAGRAASSPDCGHLHSIVSRRIIQPKLLRLSPALRNAAVAPLMWLCAAIPALLAVTFATRTDVLVVAALVWTMLYHWMYRGVMR